LELFELIGVKYAKDDSFERDRMEQKFSKVMH